MSFESLGYLVEKFRTGVESLDEWPELSPRDRLLNAYISQVINADRPGPDVPADLRERIARLHSRLRCVPDPTEGGLGTVAATVALMTEAEADASADEIRAIAAALTALRDA